MTWLTRWVSDGRQDTRHAMRALVRAPGFTAVAVLTLALGIGANSAIFSVVYGVLLAPLPFKAADRLHEVRTLYPDGTGYPLSAPDFMSVRESTRVFEQVEAFSVGRPTLLGVGEPQEVARGFVSDGLLDMLGLSVVTGRSFARQEFSPGHANVIILGDAFWRRTFGSDLSAVGRTVSLNGATYTIIGVFAPGARLPGSSSFDDIDIYTPLEYDATFSATTATARRNESLEVLGRVKPGIGSTQIEDDLRRIGAQLRTSFPDTNAQQTFTGRPLRESLLGDVRTPLLMLLGAVGFVLLIACANVANLLLARASARQHELAVRAALGAGRGRLVRQLLTESLVLGLAGGDVGLMLGFSATRVLVAAQPADIPRLDDVGVGGMVVAFTFLIAVLTSVGFGLVPAAQATGDRLTHALRAGGRGAGGRGQRLRATLIVAQIALAVVLLTGAGLLIRSFVALTRVQHGFVAEHIMAFRTSIRGPAYERADQIGGRAAQILERVRALPGVLAVDVTTVLPLRGLGPMLDYSVEGAPPPPPNVNQEIAVASVTPGYFATIGAPRRSGRTFLASDDAKAPMVAVINEAAVRRWFPNENPLGHRVRTAGRVREIVGVIGDIQQRDPSMPVAPQLFLPYAQASWRAIRIVVRAAADPLALQQAIQREIRSLDPTLAVTDFTPFDELIHGAVARPRFYTALLTLFAGVGLALASIGIFGVLAYAVAQRTQEIGIRMALGATRAQVLALVLRTGAILTTTGLLAGLATAAIVARVLRRLLFGITPLDPMTFVLVILTFGTVSAVACYVPARRATKVDPMVAVRSE